jgi:hypothetical protein
MQRALLALAVQPSCGLHARHMSLLQPLPSDDDDPLGPPTYRQRPRPIGFDLAYKLEGDVLVIDSTRKIDRVQLSAVEQVRFTFKPGNVTSTGYVTQLRLKDGKTITIGDTSWRSLVEVERGGARYIRFITAICESVARTNPKAQFLAGKPFALWAMFAGIVAVSVAMMVFFAWRAWSQGYTNTMWLGVALAAIALWQMVPMVRLNRPMTLKPGEVPSHLMPNVKPAA